MNRRAMLSAALAGAAPIAKVTGASAAERDLKALTQRLADALAPGRKDIWDAVLHPDFVSTDENGAVFTRNQFLAGLTPLPPGASGTLRVTDFAVRDFGGFAVTTYLLDEIENYHGEVLRSQYRNTDSWVRTPKGWRLGAMQEIALRKDPPAVELLRSEWEEYLGRYSLPDGVEFEIARQGDAVVGRQGRGTAQEFRAEAHDLLFMPGRPRYRYLFRRNAAGKVTGFAQRREAWDISWVKLG